MSINWKKEGYEVGQKLFIFKKDYFETISNPYQTEVTVTYVGVKILKVTDGQREFEFKGSKSANSGFWGSSYKLYNSREEFEKEQRDEAEKYEIKMKLSNSINHLSLDELRALNDAFDKIKGN
ncbi:beta barrel domain-containing protein [Clostridium disporicum]|uniref:beta barrel domain-containing protein n=1 Tax=Clostridium disporicum TaxID=84024 RepID=UPI0034A31DBB